MSHHEPLTDAERVGIAHMRSNLKGTLLEDDTHFLLDDLLMARFLRQKKGNPEKGLAALEACLAWRKERKPHRIAFEDVAVWPATGVVVIAEKTKLGVPVVYFTPPKGLKVPAEVRADFTVWYCEELMRRGYYESVTVMDFSRVDAAPSGEEERARKMIDEIRANYYPLFDSKVLLVNMPFVLRVIFGVMTAFLSEAQKSTLVTGLKPKHLLDWIDASDLSDTLGGQRSFPKSAETGGYDIFASFPPKRT